MFYLNQFDALSIYQILANQTAWNTGVFYIQFLDKFLQIPKLPQLYIKLNLIVEKLPYMHLSYWRIFFKGKHDYLNCL